ncbi:jumonji domain-containing 5 [Dothidotthia symphoricarpi CBS 119687]|uniref:Jumonji domain-containing 5 n=1 Tax=Dothidotthia symphoricarpi CBS 119687 TaxID=1392245 RepID=A0A6A6AFJ5_9PLEO|nr:jumonji domain-containing 5 [Dothidotthia symphoricarpi CBS 119687]KAF2130560.1 jumonji domain-containing 5 [Dothidotthia symphoricarpi CBS 119687]
MTTAAPTLEEITQLTRQELTTARKSDPIRECGRAALLLLPDDPELCLKLAYQKLHDVPYKDVKTCWRRLYTDASLWKVVRVVGELESKGRGEGDWIDEVVKLLDMALILTGAPEREELVELWFSAIKAVLVTFQPDFESSDRPAKRRKLSPSMQSTLSAQLPHLRPAVRHPIARATNPSLASFQTKLSNPQTHTPIIIEGAIEHWPALDDRPWNNSEYLLEQTLGGRRLIPVEIGKSYTSEGWGQRIVTFSSFMQDYILSTQTPLKKENEATGYLAQHDLFAQIPSLRADICIPDYCYCEPIPTSLPHVKATAKLEEPLLNAWFGPPGTISPLHTDPYHNVLAQVVGYKYVRLYAPEETRRLYPRSIDESGVDMSNTSQVDLDEGMAVHEEVSCWEGCGGAEGVHGDGDEHDLVERRRDFEEQFPEFKDARYIEGILGPGECLYLPVGWWHYIRSLTPSFSVSFWFN